MGRFLQQSHRVHPDNREMKKTIAILMILGICGLDSYAQWYLFPGRRKARQEAAIIKDTVSTIQAAPGTAQPDPEEIIQTDERQETEVEAENIFPDEINLSIILPLHAGSQPNSNFFEMYCGALLAVRDLGESGIKMNVNVFDSADESNPVSVEQLQESHVIFGPVAPEEIKDILKICPENTYVISPLDPKVAAYADSYRIIQSPASWTQQYDELADWIREETLPGDRIVLMNDNPMGEQSSYMISKLKQKGLDFSAVSKVSELGSFPSGTSRIVMVSDNDNYINISVRELGNQIFRKDNICLYTTSRVRNTIGAEAKHLYNMHTRMTAAYYIDYSGTEVRDFILKYRALFKAEPGSFAFQGYDAIHYFVNMCEKFGTQWHRNLNEYSERGLQTDYEFLNPEGKGYINKAVRRIVYNNDMSIVLQ